MKVSRRGFLRLSSLAAAGALAAACAKTDAPTATPKAAAPTATPKSAEPTPMPEVKWPRGEVARNRTLIRMFGQGGEYTDVGIGQCYAMTHQTSMASQLEAMFYFSALGDKTYPHLAESAEYNDDATELTIYLRKGIEWSDGTPFTAKDVAFTYNTLIARAPDYRDSARLATLTKEVIAVDDHTVKFVFTGQNYRYLFTECTFRFDRGTYLVPEHIFKDVDDWREFRFNSEANPDWPVVTGAFKIAQDTPTNKHFDRRDDWWAFKTGFMDLPHVERVLQIPFSDDTKAAQMLIRGEIDHALDLRVRTIESVLIQAPHIITYAGRNKPYGYVDWWPISMYFNTLEEPYDDKRVRWAVAYSIDQQQVVDVGNNGAGETTNGPFPYYPGLLKYSDTIGDILEKYNVLERDLDKVDDLMIEAGFEKDAEGFWVKDGERPDADIWADATLFGDIAPVVAEQMRQAGFDANHVTPPDVWDGKSDGRAMLHMFGHGGSVKDPFTTLDFYHLDKVKPTGENCGNNRPRWSTQEYSDIIDELNVTSPDDPKTFDLYRAAMEIWYEALPEVPMIQWFHRLPMNTIYWTDWPTSDDPYNSALWHLTMPITLWRLQPTQ